MSTTNTFSYIHRPVFLVAVCAALSSFVFFSCSKADDRNPVANDAVRGVYFIPHYGYMTTYFSAYLLLENGSIKKYLVSPPALLNEKQSKQQHPEDWGTWKKSGDAIVVIWNDGKSETWDTWYFGMPADKYEKLDGKYVSQNATGNEDYYAITFTDDGQFSLTEKKYGTNQTLTGSYLLDGYAITLEFDNGHKEQWAFNFYCIGHNTDQPTKNTKAFIMAEDNYSKG